MENEKTDKYIELPHRLRNMARSISDKASGASLILVGLLAGEVGLGCVAAAACSASEGNDVYSNLVARGMLGLMSFGFGFIGYEFYKAGRDVFRKHAYISR